MIDNVVSHHRIAEEPGEGSRGEVHLAEDTGLNGEVVLTHALPQHASDQEPGTRFKLRSKAAAALNHPISAAICETDRLETECSIYMEQIEGKPVERLLFVTDIQQTDTRCP
jgi:serine/threonine protein kinase